MGYFVEVEQDISLYVEDINPKGRKTLLFIHGWPLSHKQFEYQFNVLPTMGYRCIGLDWRGFGQSDKPFEGYNFDRLADDLRVVIDALHLEDVALIGHSTGGAIAIHYIARHGAKGVSKLILLDAAAPHKLDMNAANHFYQGTLNDRPEMLQEVTNQFFFQYVTPRFSDWFFQLGIQAASWSTAAVMLMLRDSSVEADLPNIGVPTLILHGIHDHVVPFSEAQEQQKRIRNAQLIPLEYSGHAGFWEERDKVNQLISQFVG